MSDLLFRPSQLAFKNAIDSGVLVLNANSPLFVGKYMYMYSEFDGTEEIWIDVFKSINTRSYRKVFNETPPHIDRLKCSPDDPEGLEFLKGISS